MIFFMSHIFRMCISSLFYVFFLFFRYFVGNGYLYSTAKIVKTFYNYIKIVYIFYGHPTYFKNLFYNIM